MQLDILNIKGEKTGRTIELPEDIFGIEPNDHAIYLAVKQFQGAQRHGNAKVKTRAEVQGSSKKLHKQKGTGGSRKGNLRNPLYKGCCTIFCPKPHGFDIKVNRKVKDLAKMSALSYKAKENSIVVLEDIKMDAPKTKTFAGLLKGLSMGRKKSLFVVPEYNDNLYLSLRNVQGVNGTVISDMNTYDILNANVLVLSESAAKLFTEEANEAAEA